MSLLTIASNVCGEAGFPIPGSIVGNSDDTAVLLLKLINRSGGILARKPWQILQKEYTFNLVSGTGNYAFPTDLGYFQDYTMWDRSQFWAMRGSLNGTDWQALKSGVQSVTPRQRFRIWKGRIYIHPVPSNTDSIVIEYISNAWVTDSLAPQPQPVVNGQTFTTTAGQTVFTLTFVPQIVFFVSLDGAVLIPTIDYTISGKVVTLTNGALAGQTLYANYSGSAPNPITPLGNYFTSFSADAQTSLIDESVIEMDTLWRFLNRKGLAYAEEKDQAERHIADLFGNDAPREPRNFGGDQEYPWPPFPTVPTTGFS